MDIFHGQAAWPIIEELGLWPTAESTDEESTKRQKDDSTKLCGGLLRWLFLYCDTVWAGWWFGCLEHVFFRHMFFALIFGKWG